MAFLEMCDDRDGLRGRFLDLERHEHSLERRRVDDG
jgi:hypothetical protein